MVFDISFQFARISLSIISIIHHFVFDNTANVFTLAVSVSFRKYSLLTQVNIVAFTVPYFFFDTNYL